MTPSNTPQKCFDRWQRGVNHIISIHHRTAPDRYASVFLSRSHCPNLIWSDPADPKTASQNIPDSVPGTVDRHTSPWGNLFSLKCDFLLIYLYDFCLHQDLWTPHLISCLFTHLEVYPEMNNNNLWYSLSPLDSNFLAVQTDDILFLFLLLQTSIFISTHVSALSKIQLFYLVLFEL